MYRQRLRYAITRPAGMAMFAAKAMTKRDGAPIITTSIGRVGSTLLYRALVDGRVRAMFGECDQAKRQLVASSCWDLNALRYRRAAIYKSHDIAPKEPWRKRCKVIFLFGRPSDVVISLFKARENKGAEWLAEHLAHMHADGPFDQILERDILRIGLHLSSWHSFRGAETLCLRYETMWNNIDVLERFVGYPISLPERIERSSAGVDAEIVAHACSTYAALDEAEARLPDCRSSA